MINRFTVLMPLGVVFLLNYVAREPAWATNAVRDKLKGGTHRMSALVTPRQGELSLESVLVPVPGDGEILVRMHYAPVNPSDVLRAFSDYSIDGDTTYPHPNGFEGVGTVVASGGGLIPFSMAKNRLRVAVTVPESGSWAEYVVTTPMNVLPVPSSMETRDAAAAFVNPATTVAFLEIANSEGHKAIVHTAANSALGLMLLRAAPKFGVTIVCVVRGAHNEAALTAVGHPADLIVRSDSDSFATDLQAAVRATGATLAFDAVSGDMSRQVFEAMPPKSKTYVYGQLSGEPMPESLMKASTPGGKEFGWFHVKNWMDEGGLIRLAKMAYRLYTMLPSELTTDFVKDLPLRDPGTLEEIKAYFGHQKGGKMLISLMPEGMADLDKAGKK